MALSFNRHSSRSALSLAVSGGLAVLLVGCGGESPAAYPGTGGASGAASSSAAGAADAAGSSNTATGGGSNAGGSSNTGGTPGAGGSNVSATAGAAGMDVAPPKVVGKCDNLAGVDVFENITPPGANLGGGTPGGPHGQGIVNVLTDPVHSGTIYVGTDTSGLLKSTDCGSTWQKVNTGRLAGNLDEGILWSMAIDPVDPSQIYLGSLYGTDSSLLKSTNGGVDFDSLFPKGSEVETTVQYNFFQDLALDPTNHKHIVVTFHANCSGPTGPNCMAETKDGGATWRLFKGPLDSWGEGAGPFVFNDTTFIMGATQNGIWYTANSGATWEKVGPGTNRQMYKSTNGAYYIGTAYGMHRSTDGGHTWSQIPNAPSSDGVMGDGKRIFTSIRYPQPGVTQPYFYSDEADGTNWKQMKSPDMDHGAVYFAYDPDHHVMYSANIASGLYRFVTQ